MLNLSQACLSFTPRANIRQENENFTQQNVNTEGKSLHLDLKKGKRKANQQISVSSQEIDQSVRYQTTPTHNTSFDEDFVVLSEDEVVAADGVIQMSSGNSFNSYRGIKAITGTILNSEQEMKDHIDREFTELIERKAERDKRNREAKQIQNWIDRIASIIILLLTVLLILFFFNPFEKENTSKGFDKFDIHVTGEFTDKDLILTALHNYRAEYDEPISNYFNQDLSKIYRLIKKMSWIKEVQIQKKWPDTITIYTKDYIPMALWDNSGDQITNEYISKSGTKFNLDLNLDQDKVDQLSKLPIFKGKENQIKYMYNMYLKLNQILLPIGIKANTIDYKSDYGIHVYLSNDVEAIFDLKNQYNEIDLDNMLENMLIILTQSPKLSNYQIERLDLRYSNGVAVKFKGKKTLDQILETSFN